VLAPDVLALLGVVAPLAPVMHQYRRPVDNSGHAPRFPPEIRQENLA
jgi:hypothetical protein